MTSRSSRSGDEHVEAVLNCVEAVRLELQQVLVHHKEPLVSRAFTRHIEWIKVARWLSGALEELANYNADVRETLYKRGIAEIRAEASQGEKTEQLAGDDRPRLSAKQKKALDFIRRKGPIKGLVVAKHVGVSEPGFRSRYVRILRQWGVRNDGEGYYVEE